jgi:hypothetical protein
MTGALSPAQHTQAFAPGTAFILGTGALTNMMMLET